MLESLSRVQYSDYLLFFSDLYCAKNMYDIITFFRFVEELRQ